MENPQTPAPGWYQDPGGPPGQLRYYDGAHWTEHRAAAAQQPQMPYGAAPYGAPQPPLGMQVPYGPPPKRIPLTPDGRPLANWGSRLGAQILDMLLIGVVELVVLLPILIPVFRDQYNHDQQWMDANPGSTNVDPFWIYRHHWQALLAAFAIALVIQAVYFMGFWRWKQATPGKMAVGLRIEYREGTGPLSWGSIVQRWLVQYAVVVAYGLGSIFVIIDGLWPLWDNQFQALHDKWPKTNVVRTK